MTNNKTSLNYSTTPYWLSDPQINLAAFTCDKNEISDNNDIVIVGGGFTGISAAITLARAGRQVIVLDAAPLGFGASCRNGGLMGPSFGKLGIDALNSLYGEAKTNEIIKESIEGFRWILDFIKSENINCHLKVAGRFRGAAHPDHFNNLKKQVEDLSSVIDFPATLISKENQGKEIGSDRYHGGVIYHDDAMLQPALLYQGLLKIATEAGVKIFENVNVNQIVNKTPNFDVMLENRTITASEVIIATNGYTGSQFGKFRRRVLPIRSAMIATEELSEDLIRSLSPNLRSHGGTERVVTYFRPSPDGKRLLFGGRASGRNDHPEQYAKFLRNIMIGVLPQLADVKIDYAWSGVVAYTFDHIPHIGKMDGLHYAMGYCGSGVVRANYFGRKIALKLLNDSEGKTAFDDFPFKTRLFYTGRPWFLPLILRWHALADKFGF